MSNKKTIIWSLVGGILVNMILLLLLEGAACTNNEYLNANRNSTTQPGMPLSCLQVGLPFHFNFYGGDLGQMVKSDGGLGLLVFLILIVYSANFINFLFWSFVVWAVLMGVRKIKNAKIKIENN